MLPRQFPRPSRVFVSVFVLSLGSIVPCRPLAQNPSYPSVPPPQPVPADTMPAMPAATPAQKPDNVPTPADAPTQNPAQAQPSTIQAQPSIINAPQPSAPTPPAGQTTGQPPYQDPLQNPTRMQQAQPATPAPGQPPYQDPLQTPIRIQPAQPGQPQPVDIAPPSPVASLPSIPTDYPMPPEHMPADHLGSTYIPVDEVIYPMALRLYSMGYLNTIFISMRPWTRRSLLHALEHSAASIKSDGNEQAMAIYAKLMEYLAAEDPGPANTLSSEMTRGRVYGAETLYSRFMGINGQTLRDSYHYGQTISDDYARPYEPGFNNITGFSTVNEWGRFSLYVRGEYQHSPAGNGYSYGLANTLSLIDSIQPFAPPNEPQPTIPYGPIPGVNPFRIQEAALSFHWLGHEFSAGKTDAWLGPAYGGAMAWSNNAENIYSFRINRVEPLHIPYVSYFLGSLRYDFFVGSLKGHTDPNSPWVHAEMFSFRPTDNFEFSFERSIIWGGEAHEPVTLGTFFQSFFSFNDVTGAVKFSTKDPGARFSDFSFSYRLPFVSHYLTLYADSIAHDDVSPISAPRRAALRPGIYLSQIPKLPKMDLRVEASSTDPKTTRSVNGKFNYFEAIQVQGYTNKGFIMGDWIGREATAEQAWLTYHLSANEYVQLEYMGKRTPNDFIPGAAKQNQIMVDVVKRLRPDLELNASYQFERWGAPAIQTAKQTDNVFTVQFKFYPKLHTQPVLGLNGKPLSASGGGSR